MTLSEAKKIAEELTGCDVPFEHRNVWVFCDEEGGDVFITKDNAPVERSGVFRLDIERDICVDIATGEEVSLDEVFGKTFFDDNPLLFEDHMTDGIEGLKDKIDALLSQTNRLLQKTNTPPIVIVMLHDLLDDAEDVVYKRLVVLNNYLASCDTDISITEFAYLHHELYTLD